MKYTIGKNPNSHKWNDAMRKKMRNRVNKMWTPEKRKKLSEKMKTLPKRFGFKHSEEWKRKARERMIGFRHTEQAKIKISESNKGEKNCKWKGDKIGYWGVHTWLIRKFGTADRCENINCKRSSENYQYAKLRDKKYERKRENFVRLCASCHQTYDRNKQENRQVILLIA